MPSPDPRYTPDPLLHQGLVRKFAARYERRGLAVGLDFDDLVQEGQLGLLRAAELYDHAAHGTTFGSYAGLWICQAIRRGIYRALYPVVVPAQFCEVFWRGSSSWSDTPVGLEADARRAIAARACQEADEDGLALAEIAVDYRGGVAAEETETPDAWPAVESALGRINPRDAEVLRLLFGVGREAPLKLKDVGPALGISWQRAGQLRKRGLRDLREMLGATVTATEVA